MYLHKYKDYEEYKNIQVIGNKQKLSYSWVNLNNLYKIAASLLAFVAIGWLISMPNKTFLSKNPNPYIKNNNSNKIHIFYNPETLSDFLYENKNNCSIPEKIDFFKSIFLLNAIVDKINIYKNLSQIYVTYINENL